jgi:hypothetical protein
MTSGSRCVGRLARVPNVLSSPDLQILGVMELRSQFAIEDEKLADAIDSAKKTIEILKKNVAKCTDSSADGKKQLEAKMDFLEAQINPITTTRDLLNADVGKCVTLPRSHDEEKRAKLREIIKLFRTFTHSLDVMRRAPSRFYLTMLEDLRTWLEANPKLGSGAGLSGGALVGGLGGWVAAQAIAEGIAIAFGSEISVGVAASVAIGATGGAVLVGGVLGLFFLYKHLYPTSPHNAAEAQHRKKIEAMLKALEKNSVQTQDIAVLRDIFGKLFAPARMPSGLHECLVCHEELRSCDDDDNHVHSDQCAVSAAGCNHHFAHQACYTKWAIKSGSTGCMVCSPPRETLHPL